MRDAPPLPRRSPRVWELGLVFTVTLLPFEPLRTIPVGPLALSLFELTLCATALAFALTRLRQRQPLPVKTTEAVVALWLGASLLSALEADMFQSLAIKSALRWVGVATLFVLVRAAPHRGRLIDVVVGTGCVVSLLGLMELSAWGGYLDPILTLFRGQTSSTQGLLRLTATFSHANQAAGFLALCLPVAVNHAMNTKRWSAIYPALILAALWATLSRAGIVAGLLTAGLVVLWHLRNGGGGRQLYAVSAPLALSPLLLFTHEAVNHRFFHPETPSLRATIHAPSVAEGCRHSYVELPVSAKNEGNLTWHPRPPHPIQLAHTLRRDDTTQTLEGKARAIVPGPVPPGDEAEFLVRLRLPKRPGTYAIHWDLVREGVGWFGDLAPPGADNPPAVTRVRVRDHGCPPPSPTVRRPRAYAPHSPPLPNQRLHSPSRAALWRAAWSLWRANPVLGTGPDTFRERYAGELAELGYGQWDTRVHANNLYLEILADTGLLGLILWLAMYGRLLFSGWKQLQTWRIGAYASIVTWGVHGILDTFLSFYGVVGLLWVCAGLATAGDEQNQESR